MIDQNPSLKICYSVTNSLGCKTFTRVFLFWLFAKVGNTNFTQQNAHYTPSITTYIITLTLNPHVYPRRDSDDDRPARKGPPPKRQQSKPKQKPPQRRKNDSDSDDSYDDDPRVDPRAKAAAALRDLDDG